MAGPYFLRLLRRCVAASAPGGGLRRLRSRLPLPRAWLWQAAAPARRPGLPSCLPCRLPGCHGGSGGLPGANREERAWPRVLARGPPITPVSNPAPHARAAPHIGQRAESYVCPFAMRRRTAAALPKGCRRARFLAQAGAWQPLGPAWGPGSLASPPLPLLPRLHGLRRAGAGPSIEEGALRHS